MHNFVKHGFMHNGFMHNYGRTQFYAQSVFFLTKALRHTVLCTILEGPGFMHNYCKFSRSKILVYVNSDRCVFLVDQTKWNKLKEKTTDLLAATMSHLMNT